MKHLFLFLAIAFGAAPALAQGQSGYGGDGKAASGATVSSFIKLYETPPAAPTLAAGAAGSTTTGAHIVKVTCYSSSGETTGGTASASVDTVTAQFAISAIPICSQAATGRRVYMNTVAAPTVFNRVSNGQIANNTATTLTVTDNDATIAGGAALPTSNTMLDNRLAIGQSLSSFTGGVQVIDGSGNSLTKIAPTGHITFGSSATSGGLGGSVRYIGFAGSASNLYFNLPTGGQYAWAVNETQIGTFTAAALTYTSSLLLAFGSSGVSSPDVALSRHAPNVLEVNTAVAGTTADLIARNIALGHGTIGTAIGAAPTHGQNLTYLTGEESLTIAAAATTDTTMQIPANAVVLSVNVRVTTVIPTAATFTVTGASSATVFNTAAVNVAATTTDAGTKSCPYYNATAQSIRITPNIQPAAATGVVRVTVVYYVVTPPTS